MQSEVRLQRDYYARTAGSYDTMHVPTDETDTHFFALNMLASFSNFYRVQTILDLGSGTGRTPIWIKSNMKDVEVVGVEPVRQMREQGWKKGLATTELVDGDTTSLNYADNSFDAVCAFSVLHHIRNPTLAVAEMLRVSKKMVFISDGNNFGQGSAISRLIKQTVHAMGLWPLLNLIKTRGKGYSITEGDGLAYSYSIQEFQANQEGLPHDLSLQLFRYTIDRPLPWGR